MSLAGLFSRRYLFSRKSHSVINIIASVSTLSVAIPVAAMIILLSVFNGFESLVRSLYSTFDADLTIMPSVGTSFEKEALSSEQIREIEGVAAVSFVAEQSVIAAYGGRRATIELKGVDDSYFDVVPMREALTAGRAQTRVGDFDYAYVGQGVAYALGINTLVNTDVEFYALSRNRFSSLLPMDNYRKTRLPASGIFSLDAATDGRYVITSLREAQRLFSYGSRVTALEVALDGSRPVERVQRDVEELVGEEFQVKSREEKNATMYGILRAEKWGIFFISLMVLIVASFSIVGALAMLIIEKRDDIKTLSAMGADRGLVRRIFIGEGSLISGIGATIGIMLGVGLCLVQQYFGVITIPSENLLLSEYPVELRFWDMVVVVVAMFAVTQLISRLTVRVMIRNV